MLSVYSGSPPNGGLFLKFESHTSSAVHTQGTDVVPIHLRGSGGG